MKTSNRLWKGLACGGLSLALIGGLAPVSAVAANNASSEKSNDMKEHRQELRAMHQKMMAEATTCWSGTKNMIAEERRQPAKPYSNCSVCDTAP